MDVPSIVGADHRIRCGYDAARAGGGEEDVPESPRAPQTRGPKGSSLDTTRRGGKTYSTGGRGTRAEAGRAAPAGAASHALASGCLTCPRVPVTKQAGLGSRL